MNPDRSNGQENKGPSQFFAQKSEKLATAVYMITDIIDAREPLRWKMREEAMEILSLIATQQGGSSVGSNVLYRLTQAIERILHILILAENTKLISVMNASIVRKEYSELKEKISMSWSENAEERSPRLDHRFFKVGSLPALSGSEKSFPQQDIKRTSVPVADNIGHKVVQPMNPIAPIVSDTRTDMKASFMSDTVNEEKKVDRKSVIVSLLRRKPEVSVSDVMKELPDVSDKTIQRDLVALVQSGVLVKKGEKRWSTYSLKN